MAQPIIWYDIVPPATDSALMCEPGRTNTVTVLFARIR
jgi:hypothetical protein